jgi:hypothetical protein
MLSGKEKEKTEPKSPATIEEVVVQAALVFVVLVLEF